MIQRVKEVVLKLKAIRGKNTKLTYLTFIKDMPGLQAFFKLCLCPSFNYYHTKLPAPTTQALTSKLDVIATLSLAGQAKKPSDSKALLQLVHRHGNEFDIWFAERVLARKPDCGIDTAVNKVWPGCVRTQIYQGAIADNEEKIQKLFDKCGQVMVEVKEDGMHIICEGKPNVGQSVRSRQGEDLRNPTALQMHISMLVGAARCGNYYIAGEGLIKDDTTLTGYMDRATGNALINEGNYHNFRYVVWDLLTQEQVANPKACDKLLSRRIRLQQKFVSYFKRCEEMDVKPIIKLSTLRLYVGLDNALAWKEKKITQGCEGVVFKDPCHTFKNGKPSSIIKGTFAMDMDALVIGTTPHKQKAGQIGAYLVEVPAGASNPKICCKVGSGLTEALRTEGSDVAIGRVVTITIKDLSKAKTKNAVLSCTNPRLAATRNQFKEADCSDDVFERYANKTGRRHSLDVIQF